MGFEVEESQEDYIERLEIDLEKALLRIHFLRVGLGIISKTKTAEGTEMIATAHLESDNETEKED